MSGQFPLRVSPSGPFEDLGEPSLLANLEQFSKFGTGLTTRADIFPGVEVVKVNEPIPNTGAPGDGQLFEIEANLAMYFNSDSGGGTVNNKITAVCVLDLDDGTTQNVPLPGPGTSFPGPVQPAYRGTGPYNWTARARASVPANRTVVSAGVRLLAESNTGDPETMAGSPSPYNLKITRLR